LRIVNTEKIEDVFLHVYDTDWDAIVWGGPALGLRQNFSLDVPRAKPFSVIIRDSSFALGLARSGKQGSGAKGSYVGPEKLTFGF